MKLIVTVLAGLLYLSGCQVNDFTGSVPATVPPPTTEAAASSEPAGIDLTTGSDTAVAAKRFDQLLQSVTPTISTVFVQNGYAYLNLGPILAILDVSDPKIPDLVGAIKLPVETITDVTVHEGVAYVAALEAGLRIVDVSDPARPIEVGVYHPPLTGGIAKNYTGSGPEPVVPFYNHQGVYSAAVDQTRGKDYAYVAALGAGLRIVDISDPVRPAEVGSLAPAEGGVVDVVVTDGHAYLVNPDEGLQIIDISEVTRPVVSGLNSRGWGFAIAPDPKESHTLYIAYGSCSSIVNECPGGVHITDVSDPAKPQPSSISEPLLSFSLKLATGRQRIYVATMNGLSIVNVTDPTHPEVEAFDSFVPPSDLVVVGETLYLAAGVHGLQIFDLSNPAAPVAVSGWQPVNEPAQDAGRDQNWEEPTASPESTLEPVQDNAVNQK